METKPIVIDGCKERVAFDLMEKLASLEKEESMKIKREDNPRQYYFNLFKECLEVVSNKPK